MEHTNRTAAPETAAVDEEITAIRGLLETSMSAEAIVRLSRLRAPDQADVVARLPRDSRKRLLGWLTPQTLGQIIDELPPTQGR